MITKSLRRGRSNVDDYAGDSSQKASLGATFAALLEQMGPSNEGGQGVPMPSEAGSVAGAVVSRPGQQQLGHFWG